MKKRGDYPIVRDIDEIQKQKIVSALEAHHEHTQVNSISFDLEQRFMNLE
jgi:hypothetical protein